MDVGATLRSAREARGLSLDELSERTKISVRLLRALEQNADDALPRGIFRRGYLRAYAAEVGLDPAAIIETCVAQSEPPERAPSTTEQRAGSGRRQDPLVGQAHGRFDPAAAGSSGNEAGKVVAIALVSLAFVVYLSLMSRNAEDATEPPPPAAAAAPTGTEAVLSRSDAGEPVATTGSALDVEIRSTGPCWVEAIADGSRRVYRLMDAGDREAITVHEDLTLKVGDPSAFQFSINGREGRLPGRPGQPITVRIDAGNAADFLRG